jgi:hypothetical protein
MCKATPLLVLGLLLLTCCEQHPIVRDPPQDFISLDDSCGNYYPPYADMGFKPANEWPFLAGAAGGKVSPDGNYLAYGGFNTDYLQHGHSLPIGGIAVMDLRSNSHLLFLPARAFTWSQDSRRLYYCNLAKIVCATDIDTKETRSFPELGVFERIASAPIGRLILLAGVKAGVPKYGIVKWDPVRDSVEFIISDEEMNLHFMALNDSVLCAVSLASESFKGLVYLNTNTLAKWRIEVPAFNSNFAKPVVAGVALSPNGDKIVFEPYVDTESNDGYSRPGVWILNRLTLELRQILPRHLYVDGNYLPTWRSNDRILASWPCVCDSAISLYEYDLQGKPLRRYTDRYTKFWEVQ